MRNNKIERIRDKEFSIPEDYLPTQYFDVFNTLHRYENKLRVFTYSILKAARGRDWTSSVVKGDVIERNNTIEGVFKKRRNQLSEYGHISELPNVPMLYLTLDDLASLITNPLNIDLFKPNFPDASLAHVYKPKIWETIITRNHLTHFRKLRSIDIERLNLNMADIMKPLEDYIRELIDPPFLQYVPLQKLSYYPFWTSMTMKTRKHSAIGLLQNRKETWIKIKIFFKDQFLGSLSDGEGKEYAYSAIVDSEKLTNSLTPILTHIVYFMNSVATFPARPESLPMGGVSLEDISIGGESCGNKVELVISSERFLKCYEDILPFIMELLDDVEDDYTKSRGVFTDRDLTLKFLKVGQELANENELIDGTPAEDVDEESNLPQAEGRLAEAIRMHGIIPRKDIPEDWTSLSSCKRDSLIAGDMPWLI
jgi:hypothetical protein